MRSASPSERAFDDVPSVRASSRRVESTIRRWVAGESTRYADAKIQIYVPVLVQRIVDSTLRELARTEGTSSNALSLGEAERMAVS